MTQSTASEGHNSIGLRSREAFARAQRVFPDGTTRVPIDRDPIPRYVDRGEGAYVFDVDGRRFLDLNGNFATLIHGHSFEPVIAAVTSQLRSGTCLANPTLSEIDLAELICVRAVEALRFVNTRTEAVMIAIKAARAFSSRSAIAKIEGAYHGSYDRAEINLASGPKNWGPTDMPATTSSYRGAPVSVLDEVIPLRFNQPSVAEQFIEANASKLGAILIDMMPGRAGYITPTPEFLGAIQRVARKHDILIIADDVLNFRLGYEGSAARYGLAADIFTFGKIIGGDLPIGAIGGRRDVMSVFEASKGRPAVPHGGAFSANPLSMCAGPASMKALDHAPFAHSRPSATDFVTSCELRSPGAECPSRYRERDLSSGSIRSLCFRRSSVKPWRRRRRLACCWSSREHSPGMAGASRRPREQRATHMA
ncbi:aspartate aminotransferase family protein [Bradyrhizobium sp. CCBAU 11430]|uniref:aspartate aminotransferase family protein n=1 Tax=Bradyrhizobium sp. CCBAU 11430 TaxID=1630881 RepID=UPI0023057F2F|nr:aminotransferase class III-fold pyridoxal phosphate-dependent enzyme [Bradyrhizobium sp. CCBAU 11430]